MNNEEQIADTIEMLYQRLNGYNKQDLFNYGYLLESNQILCKDIEEKDKEIEKLNNIIQTLNSVCSSMQFSAPENMYIHLQRMIEVLDYWKKENKND